jgi:hypothetical protein
VSCGHPPGNAPYAKTELLHRQQILSNYLSKEQQWKEDKSQRRKKGMPDSIPSQPTTKYRKKKTV